MHGRLRVDAGAQWMATNLKPIKGGQLDWTFDLKGINELCGSWSKLAVLVAPQRSNLASSDGPARFWAALRTREGRLSLPDLHEGAAVPLSSACPRLSFRTLNTQIWLVRTV